MIPELGHFALIAALMVAVLQTLVPAYGIWKRDRRLMALASSAAQTQFLLIVLAYICLTYAFVTRDWSVAYVAANSEASLPLIYRLPAVWGAPEGSLLLRSETRLLGKACVSTCRSRWSPYPQKNKNKI